MIVLYHKWCKALVRVFKCIIWFIPSVQLFQLIENTCRKNIVEIITALSSPPIATDEQKTVSKKLSLNKGNFLIIEMTLNDS